MSDPEWGPTTAFIQAEVESAFETLDDVAIDFSGWGLCPDWSNPQLGTLSDQIRIMLKINPADVTSNFGYRTCEVGDVTTGDCAGDVGYPFGDEGLVWLNRYSYDDLGDSWTTALLHEFGHGLGFWHEHDRDDNTLGDHDCNGNGAGGLGTYVTEYDSESIMNGSYCRADGSQYWPAALSEIDRLGLEITYGDAVHHAVRVLGGSGFQTAEGIVLRDDAVLVDDWSYRGAGADAYFALPSWRERDAMGAPVGGVLGTGSLSASSLPYREVRVGADFVAFGSAAHTAGPEIVVVDASLHTALVDAVL